MLPLPTVAVIDDDTVFIDLMRELLEDEGYSVLSCKNGREAFALVREHNPDVIVLDLRLETPDAGWLVLEMLRLDPATADIPIILCSADAGFIREKEEQLRDHNVDFLEKPFVLDELLAKIEGNLPPREAEA